MLQTIDRSFIDPLIDQASNPNTYEAIEGIGSAAKYVKTVLDAPIFVFWSLRLDNCRRSLDNAHYQQHTHPIFTTNRYCWPPSYARIADMLPSDRQQSEMFGVDLISEAVVGRITGAKR